MRDYTKPADVSANSAVYVVICHDPLSKDKSNPVLYIKTRTDLFTINDSHLEIKGMIISKTELEKLRKEKNREMEVDVELQLPIHQWIRSYRIS